MVYLNGHDMLSGLARILESKVLTITFPEVSSFFQNQALPNLH